MKKIWDTLQTDVGQIFQPKVATIDPHQQFSRMPVSGRDIRLYDGFLPCARRTARHIVKCEHLRHIPSEGPKPYCFQPNYSHQLWIWYRLNRDSEQLHLLFRGQFDFTLLNKNPDWVAGEVADFLAFLLINCKTHHREIFRNHNSEIFWASAVERKFTSLSCELRD